MLVIYNETDRCGRIGGYASWQEVFAAPIREGKDGSYHYIPEEHLHKPEPKGD